MNRMHVFGQHFQHDDIKVVGTTEALVGLRDAINDALNTGSGGCLSFAGDGEGFRTLVVKKDEPELYDTLYLPYTDDVACDRRDEVVLPNAAMMPEIGTARKKAKEQEDQYIADKKDR